MDETLSELIGRVYAPNGIALNPKARGGEIQALMMAYKRVGHDTVASLLEDQVKDFLLSRHKES